MKKKFLIGNWKMNGSPDEIAYCKDLAKRIPPASSRPDTMAIQYGICPPFPLIAPMVEAAAGVDIWIGAQDCHGEERGAYTGDISAALIAGLGASCVLVGHSERRQGHHETSQDVARKTLAAQKAGLTAILCVGEVLDKREAGEAVGFVTDQLSKSLPDDAVDPEKLMIAYEPVWAIGTGLTPTLDDIGEMHAAIRKTLHQRFGEEKAADIAILYGGSVTAEKAEILKVPHVDGALVGGASLKVNSFAAIAEAYSAL